MKRQLLFLTISFILLSGFAQQSTQKYLVGYGKTDITYLQPNLGFFGYGTYSHRLSECASPSEIESRLYSRTVNIMDPNTTKEALIVHVDLGGISDALRKGVIQKMRSVSPDFDQAAIIFSASHTHHAPSGFSEYPLYMASNAPGLQTSFLNFLVEQIFQSIIMAQNNRTESTIEMKEGRFSDNIPIAFNRSLKAYNRNPDKERSFHRNETNLAINREMPLMNFKDSQGNHKGFINWFGVHPIEIKPDTKKINGASKGYAATFAEENMPEGTIAIFAQSGAGDVMTSDMHNKETYTAQMSQIIGDSEYNPKLTSVPHSKWNGNQQALKALDIQKNHPTLLQISGNIDYELIYIDMPNVTVFSEFSNGDSQAKIGQPAMGLPALAGDDLCGRNQFEYDYNPEFSLTSGAVGFGYFLRWVVETFSQAPSSQEIAYRNEQEKAHSPKKRIVDHYSKKFLDMDIVTTRNPEDLHCLYKLFRELIINQDLILKQTFISGEQGALEEHTLVPTILPIQIIIIGNIAIAGIPGEITTIAHNRLKNTIQEVLAQRGIDKVLVTSYANEFIGYTTTYDEYLFQDYEGGHTIFGKHQLGAFQTEFKKLATEMLKPKGSRNLNYDLKPPLFSQYELSLRSNLTPLETQPCTTENRSVANDITSEKESLNKLIEQFSGVLQKIDSKEEMLAIEAMGQDIDFGTLNLNEIKNVLVKIDEIVTEELVLYPNPSSNRVTVANLKTKESLSEIRVCTILGQNVTNKIRILNKSNTKIEIDTKNLVSGIYIIECNGKNKKFTKE
ncbi:Por secretion system C-terminal sorting domain-containing protein [Tenacibaculum sp. MAR_2009_124]|uniref:neutral/alkaline non-lysosomal ceramidase N-terminal domain-containing protein n=1 Tax=Tenacibaculum sp. MAR_2009_124 TaxID=1250059 RepID=UPI00089930CE|nr:neutral/alkaline non-lysosomal ceramidase N-terminal domain-containing protein [Tenacibaculum sp. MAR_2009_124]SEB41666.1 Por secretion system C-terminal sorting domain-containing protein [Tenacibaculum sp. MAR_2009_124]